MISVAKEDFKGQKDSKDKHHDVTIRISNKTDIATDLNNLLERFVFRTMNERVSVLKTLDATTERADNVELDTKYIALNLTEQFRKLLYTYQKLNTSHAINHTGIASIIPPAMIKKGVSLNENVASSLPRLIKDVTIDGKYMYEIGILHAE